MIWLMVNIKVCLKEQNHVSFKEIELLKLQVMQNIIDMN